MAKRRQRTSQGLVQQDLLGRVHHVVVTANDGIDIHGNVVHHHDEIIGRCAVAAANDEIVQFVILEYDIAFDDIVDHGGAG